MTAYKTTAHILANPYERMPDNLDSGFEYYKVDKNLTLDSPPSISDIKMWEQLYYESGVVGIYVSYDPKIEFYMITYNVFIDKEKGIETFFGSNAVEELVSRANKLGIDLPVVTEYVKIN